jgi:hypothetical protein
VDIPIDQSGVTVPEVIVDNRAAYRIGCPMLRVLPLQTITDQFFLGWHEVALDVRGIFVEEDFHVQSLMSSGASEHTRQHRMSVSASWSSRILR